MLRLGPAFGDAVVVEGITFSSSTSLTPGKYRLTATRGNDEVLRKGFRDFDEACQAAAQHWCGTPIAKSG